MLDGAHTGAHRTLDRLGAVGVRADIGAPAGRLVHRGLDLVDAILQAFQRIGLRGDAAGYHDLDVIGTFAQLVARRLDDFGNAVGNAAEPVEAGATGAEVLRFGTQAGFAVAAGLAERRARDEQPRPYEQPLLHRSLDAPVGAAGVAQRGKAAHQHGAHGGGGLGRHQGERRVGEESNIHFGEHDVDMGVDQSWHQRAAAEVDALCRGAGDRAIGDLADDAVLHQNVHVVLQFVAAGIEKAEVIKEEAGHAWLTAMGGVGCSLCRSVGGAKALSVIARPKGPKQSPAWRTTGGSSGRRLLRRSAPRNDSGDDAKIERYGARLLDTISNVLLLSPGISRIRRSSPCISSCLSESTRRHCPSGATIRAATCGLRGSSSTMVSARNRYPSPDAA